MFKNDMLESSGIFLLFFIFLTAHSFFSTFPCVVLYKKRLVENNTGVHWAMTRPASSALAMAAEIWFAAMHWDWCSVKSPLPKIAEYYAQEKRCSLAEVREIWRYESRFKPDANRKEMGIDWDTSCLEGNWVKGIKLDPKSQTPNF